MKNMLEWFALFCDTIGDDRLRQRDSWCVFASVRDRTVSRYPTVQTISANTGRQHGLVASLAERLGLRGVRDLVPVFA